MPLPLPGGVTITLGLAGGPLIVALVLGAWHRTGPLVWSLPYSANLTLRQLGLILFLAGVGTRAGYAFFTTIAHGAGLTIFLVGALVTTLTATAMLWAGRRLLKIPMGQLSGMLAGLQTQPAVLGFALEKRRFGCYRPPLASPKWQARLAGWERKAGDWQLSGGGFYLLVARKIVVGLRPLRQERREPMGKLIPLPMAKVNRRRIEP